MATEFGLLCHYKLTVKYIYFWNWEHVAIYCSLEQNYSRTLIIWINWDSEPSGYAENPDNWTFLGK
jgi:hypothetical protein